MEWGGSTSFLSANHIIKVPPRLQKLACQQYREHISANLTFEPL